MMYDDASLNERKSTENTVGNGYRIVVCFEKSLPEQYFFTDKRLFGKCFGNSNTLFELS